MPGAGVGGSGGSAGRRALGVVVVRVLEPGEHLAQLAAGLLDRVGLAPGAQLLELGRTGLLVVHEALREGAGLDVGEDRFMFSFTSGVMTRGPET